MDGSFTAGAGDEIELSSGELWFLIDYYCITEIGDDLVGELKANFLVSLLATPVKDRNLHFVAGLQELGDPYPS